MKRGFKKIFLITFSLIAVLSASVLSVIVKTQTKVSYAVQTTPGDNYSQKDINNLILSAEKVEIAPTGNQVDTAPNLTDRILTNDTEFRDTTKYNGGINNGTFNGPFNKYLNVSAKDMYVKTIDTDIVEGKDYYTLNSSNNYEKVSIPNKSDIDSYYEKSNKYFYNNIANGLNEKYVIQNDSFVMLNNKLVGNNYAKLNTATNTYDTTKAEGVLLTFGGYIYNVEDGQISSNNESTWAGITNLHVTATLNGNKIELPGVRDDYTQSEPKEYNDFTVIIPQISGWEGYYKFNFTYYFDEQKYEQSFGFYIIYNSSYNNTFKSENNNLYQSYPTMEIGDQINPTTPNFTLGVTGKNYPTLTYDFTKYDLTYTHTTKGHIYPYSINHTTTQNMGTTSHYLAINDGAPKLMTTTKNTLVTVVFTEMGNYNFTFKMVYKGYGDEKQPDNLSTINYSLSIDGVQLNYSDTDETITQLKYLIFSSNENDEVGLLVPNGFLRGTPQPDKNVSLEYSLDNKSTDKVGRVVDVDSTDSTNKTQDANIRLTLGDTGASNLISKITSISAGTAPLIDQNLYVSTNQGPLSILTNNNYDDTSFYIQSINPILESDIANKKNFNNKVTFNTVGYYLVFIDLDVSNSSSNYQIFAFQFNSDTIEINVTTKDANGNDIPLGAGEYTNKEVTVKWAEPGVFDREITACYYQSTNSYKTLEELEMLTPSQLNNPHTFNVNDGDFACFLIELRGEEKTKAQRTFFIDKSPLTGVNSYRVDKFISGLGYSYEFQTDTNGYYITTQGLTDDLLTLFWDDKASKANVTAKYYFIPFVKDGEVNEIASDTSISYLTNGYKLGNVIGPLSFDRPLNKTNQLVEKQVFSAQGVYYFTITDQAGNETNYMFIIDDTEMYFKVGGEYLSNEYLLKDDDVTVNLSTHKAIDLNGGDDSNGSDIANKIINNIYNDSISNYYAGKDSNLRYLQERLHKPSTSSNIYLLVKQNSYLVNDEHNVIKEQKNLDAKKTIAISKPNEDEIFVIRNIYLLGENQTKSIANSKSNITIEINLDEVRGMAYYSNDSLVLQDIPNGQLSNDKGNIKRLILENNSLSKTHATKDNKLAFVWNLNVGETKLTKLELTKYELNIDSFTDNYFFANHTTETIFEDGSSTLTFDSEDETRALKYIDITKNGLYVITRTLANGKTLTYKFIIDRMGILEADRLDKDNEDKDNLNILINLLENETQFTNFANPGYNNGKIEYFDNISNEKIDFTYKYFITNKVPATITIPKSKFINNDGNESTYESTYNAGRLSYKVYFKDTQSQLGLNQPIIILQGNVDSESTETGNYTINLETGLETNGHKQYINKFKKGNNPSNWLTLPGDYVVVITDSVETTGTKTEQVIAFRIKSKYPTINVFASNNDNATTGTEAYGSNGKYNLTTNKRYIYVKLPAYLENQLSAQLDTNYLVITKDGSDYLRHEYKHISGEKLPTAQQDGSVLVKIDTFVNLQPSFEKSEYKITARFKLNNAKSEVDKSDNDLYKNCYYDGDTAYYEVNVTVDLDRTAPTKNLSYLLENDKLVKFYEKEQNATMFVDAQIEKIGETYFVKQYNKFYQTNNSNDLYALTLYGDTTIDKEDTEYMYVNPITSLASFGWDLPITYTPIGVEDKDVNTFAKLYSSFETGKYYEIIEQDKAGNLTQYLVLYCGATKADTNIDDLQIEIPVIGIEQNMNLSIDLSNENKSSNLTMFGFTDGDGTVDWGEVDKVTDYYYYFELSKNGDIVHSFTTNSENKNNIIAKIKQMFTSAGNYTLTVESRTNTQTIQVNYITEKVALSAQDLVQAGNTYYINLNGANIEKDGVKYYATKVTVSYTAENGFKTDTYKYEDNGWTLNGNSVDSIIQCLPNTTYDILLTDICNNNSPYMFNTNGKEFTTISFGEDGNANFIKVGETYTAYNNAKIYFDNIFTKVEINDIPYNQTDGIWNTTSSEITIGTDDISNYILLDYKKADSKIIEEKTEYNISFYINEKEKIKYSVIIDNRSANVSLDEVSTDKAQSMVVDYNLNDITLTTVETSSSGVMNLIWSDYQNENYNYRYSLFEWTDVKNNIYTEHDLKNATTYTINTSKDSDGLYRFVVTVLDKQGNELGNKIYTFKVQAKLNQLYFVEKDNVAISPNSYFTIADIANEEGGYLINAEELGINNEALPSGNIPLYITNSTLKLVYATDLGADMLSSSATLDDADTATEEDDIIFTLYRVFTHSISQYVGVLQVAKTSNIVNDIKIIQSNQSNPSDKNQTTNVNPQDSLSYTIKGQFNDEITLNFNQSNLKTNYDIEQKNTITLKVYYNLSYQSGEDAKENALVGEFNLANTDAGYTYTIKGNGQYTFVFSDLAGNEHVFETTYNQTSELNINVLREVIVGVGETNQAFVNNSYYNDEVTINILQAQNYDFASVNVKATLNGSEYNYKKSQYSYTFSNFGTYKVVIKATIDGDTISKTLNFTIINPNEARNAIDLTSLTGYDITKVEYNNKDVTNDFINFFLNRNYNNGALLTYEELTSYNDIKNTYSSQGKKLFSLTYQVKDEIYPTREQTFQFTLNNEIPYVECSLKPGESTTKQFTVSYNPGIIFSQVGDCELWIGDMVFKIDSSSQKTLVTQTISQKEHGIGDYYITLKGTSGNVILSYKVVIKEPLNVWAIVIIVVAVLVVGTVVTIIIVLRTRMRIR